MKLLRQYRELYYLIFFIPQLACVSWGLGSGDWMYQAVFGLGLPFLLLSMAGGEYCLVDWGKILFILFFAGWAFLRNGSRSLILSFLAVAGAKGLDIKRLLKISFWILLATMAVKVSLSAMGILPNVSVYLPKEDGVWYTIYSFGYASPNNLYFHLTMAVLLGAAVCGERVRWLAAAGVTVGMYFMYRLLRCRTGWICFLFFLGLYALCRVSRDRGWVQLRWMLDRGMTVSYGVFALLNWGMLFAYAQGAGCMKQINTVMNNRFGWAADAVCSWGLSLLGSSGAGQLDMLYASLLVNYGILTTALFIGAHIRAMWVLHKKQEYLVLVGMTTAALYSFMEVNAVNLMWNPFLLYLTIPLFEGDTNAQNTAVLL